jgi:hypothetical protein
MSNSKTSQVCKIDAPALTREYIAAAEKIADIVDEIGDMTVIDFAWKICDQRRRTRDEFEKMPVHTLPPIVKRHLLECSMNSED